MEKQKLPNATTSLVLGILSIVTCICYGVIGLPLGIIAFILGNKAMKEFRIILKIMKALETLLLEK